MNVPISAGSLVADQVEAEHVQGGGLLNSREIDRLDAYWRAANYLSVGQIYLL